MVDRVATRYEILVEGEVSESWAVWFGDVGISPDGTETVLTVSAVDEAALQGLLAQLYTLGLHLISVRRLYDDPSRRGEP